MRTLLSRLLPLFFVGLFLWACFQEAQPDVAEQQAWSVQMHVHGSFSEGMGSIDSHSFEASRLGLDAIWWSDHDFRISSYQHVDYFGFEGPSEAVDAGENWQVKLKRHAADEKTIRLAASVARGSLSFVTEPVRAGERSLMLRAKVNGAAFQSQACILAASRKLQRRPLAGGLELALSVFPKGLGPDARPYVRLLVSEHAPREGLGLEQYSLRYFLTEQPAPAYREGSTFHIPLQAMDGVWNDLRLQVSSDVARGFAFAPARDNALYRIIVGVESRRGQPAQAAFDDLRLSHVLRGPEMLALQRDVLDEVGRLYPGLEQHQGLEVSYASRHLNEFSLHPKMIDYDAVGERLGLDPSTGFYPEAAFRRAVTRAAVNGAHARGGLISYNHLFGVGMENAAQGRTREAVLEMMVRNKGFGVDILEVGYRDRAGADLAQHLWVWDQMGLAGLRPVGTGVSDSHGGPAERWSGRPNNFVSWIYAPDPSKAALLEGLRRGRVFFGDIELFDGRLDLETSTGFRMGQVLVSDRLEQELELQVSGAQAGDLLVLIDGGRDVQRTTLESSAQTVRYTHRRATEGASLVRLELRSSSGAAKAFSNPIHWVHPAELDPGGTLAPARVGLELRGLRSERLQGFELRGIGPQGEAGLGLIGALAPGVQEAELQFALGSFGAPSGVRFEGGLRGEWSVEAARLRILVRGDQGSVVILP